MSSHHKVFLLLFCYWEHSANWIYSGNHFYTTDQPNLSNTYPLYLQDVFKLFLNKTEKKIGGKFLTLWHAAFERRNYEVDKDMPWAE